LGDIWWKLRIFSGRTFSMGKLTSLVLSHMNPRVVHSSIRKVCSGANGKTEIFFLWLHRANVNHKIFLSSKNIFREYFEGRKFFSMNIARDCAVSWALYNDISCWRKYLEGENISSRNLVRWSCGGSLH
jgi:hypothetical protein